MFRLLAFCPKWSEVNLVTETMDTRTVADVYKDLLAFDENRRKYLTARSKILRALAKRPLNFTGLQKATRLSSSTLDDHLDRLKEQRVVISKGSGYYLNEQVPLFLAAVGVSLGPLIPQPAIDEPFPLVYRQHGKLVLTRIGESLVCQLTGHVSNQRNKSVTIDEILNRILWTGLHSLAPIQITDPRTVSRDPVSGGRLQKGEGDCPECHTGMMRELKPPSYWFCPTCGIQRGGSFKPDALPPPQN